MPEIVLHNGQKRRFCVLIPSRGRATVLAKTLEKMPWLNDGDTYVGFEHCEAPPYVHALNRFPHIERISYNNPLGSVAVARERLRRHVVEQMPATRYQYYVVTDDNARHKSKEALFNLARACAEWTEKWGPCIMAGMHNTAAHFDRGKIGKAKTLNGLRSYPAVAMIFQCYPRSLYERYEYPPDAFGLDDRHFFLWCLAQGVTRFRVCMDAPFTKSRHQPGGQGTLDERAEKTGRAIARLAADFPKFVGSMGTLKIPWQHVIQTVKNHGTITGTRLVGGAMRKEETLQTGTNRRVAIH